MERCHDCVNKDVCISPQGTCDNYEHKYLHEKGLYYAPCYIRTEEGMFDPVKDEFVYNIDKPVEK